MARGVDVSGLSPAERALAAAGVVLFVDGFIPWWYRIKTPQRTYLHNAGLTGWGLIAVVAGFAVATFALAHAVRPRRRIRRDYLVYSGLGALAVVALAFQARHSVQEWFGYWLAVATAITIMIAGARRFSERRSGWI